MSSPETPPTALTNSHVPSAKPSRRVPSDPTSGPMDLTSSDPSVAPFATPSFEPADLTSAPPTPVPSPVPSDPSSGPMVLTSSDPTFAPFATPSFEPTDLTSAPPTPVPSPVPTESTSPSFLPTQIPSSTPTSRPSNKPSIRPTRSPAPSEEPTQNPTPPPSVSLAPTVSLVPTLAPTQFPVSGRVTPLNAQEHWSFVTKPFDTTLTVTINTLFLIVVTVNMFAIAMRCIQKGRLRNLEAELGENFLANEINFGPLQDREMVKGESVTDHVANHHSDREDQEEEKEEEKDDGTATEDDGKVGEVISDEMRTGKNSFAAGYASSLKDDHDQTWNAYNESKAKVKRWARTMRVCSLVAFFLYFGLEYTIRVGRFSAMWQVGHLYDPVFNEDTGELAYIYRPYFDAMKPSDEELEASGCSSLIGPSRNYTNASKGTCQVGMVRLPISLVTKGFSKFSIILGFFILLGLEVVVLFLESMLESWLEQKREKGEISGCRHLCLTVAMHLVGYGVFLVFTSHQAMVLMPTTTVFPRPYCLEFALPNGGWSSTERVVCQHVWSTAGIPIGLPLMLAAYVCFYLAAFTNADGEDNETRNIVAFFRIGALIGGCVALIPGLAFLGSWFVIGLAFGPWLHFATLTEQIVFAVSECLATILFLGNDVLANLLNF